MSCRPHRIAPATSCTAQYLRLPSTHPQAAHVQKACQVSRQAAIHTTPSESNSSRAQHLARLIPVTHAHAFDKGISLDNVSQLSPGPRARYLHSAGALIVPCTRTPDLCLLFQGRAWDACTAGQLTRAAPKGPWARSSVSGGGCLDGRSPPPIAQVVHCRDIRLLCHGEP